MFTHTQTKRKGYKMAKTIKLQCESCGSSSILYAKKKNIYWCRKCGNEWPKVIEKDNLCSFCNEKEKDNGDHHDCDPDLCFTCNFWKKYVGLKNDPRSVRINGEHYWLGDDNGTPDRYKGYGGRQFKIRCLNVSGSSITVTTTDLWYQGEIPERFRADLPDNANWIEGDKKNG